MTKKITKDIVLKGSAIYDDMDDSTADELLTNKIKDDDTNEGDKANDLYSKFKQRWAAYLSREY